LVNIKDVVKGGMEKQQVIMKKIKSISFKCIEIETL